MLLIPCPICGDRPEDEFGFGGDATVVHPGHGVSTADYAEYLYFRDNPKGPHRELWVHRYGCRRWIVVERDTLTHHIAGASLAADRDPTP